MKEPKVLQALGPQMPAPTVRLAVAIQRDTQIERMTPGFEAAPTVRLAHVAGAQGDNVLLGQRSVERLPDTSLPALLVSFFYLKGFLVVRDKWAFRDWALDSGAFSAKNSGKEINLEDYINTCKELRSMDAKLSDIFALDVIGDWRASEVNTKKMWAAGVEAIPAFHIGEPWDVLKGLAADYPKIALGGVALLKGGAKMRWLTECFSRVWPKKIHGFGISGRKIVMALPFHSVDATNWELQACKYGNWASFGDLSVRGSKQNLRAEVEYYLKLERDLRSRWENEMKLLEAQGPTMRLACTGSPTWETQGKAIGLGPDLRLGISGDATSAECTKNAIRTSGLGYKKGDPTP